MMSTESLRQDHLLIPQGTTWTMRWPLTDAEGNPLDTAGWTVRAQVRARHGAPTVLYEWSSALGNATIGPTSVDLTVAAAVSSAWGWRTGVYDVELTTAQGVVTRLTQGTVTVDPEVTL